jgi:hypothetical protein
MDARRRLARLLGHGSLSRGPQAPDERPLGEAAPRVEASERAERAGIEGDGGAPGARGAAFEGERGAVADAVGTSGDEAIDGGAPGARGVAVEGARGAVADAGGTSGD